MTSERATRANRSNAKASTGPRTRAGKARSGQNARKHGLSAAGSNAGVDTEVARLVELIIGEYGGDEVTRDAARSLAEAQVQVRSVRGFLPDRDAGSVAAWLRAHPGIEVIARDRADVFADGACAGAPQAQHVLDRFHLLRNLSVALRAIVAHHHGVIRAVGRARVDQEVEAARAVAGAARLPTAIEVRKRATHAPRRARHSELKRLSEAGASVAGMARDLDLDRMTARVWLRHDAPPSWQ